ncbi:MAG: T9SS type A sorting domain-containing protein [Bacteroidota bacterium]|nr:T9SS type A sorting domain-containing protein [Bacteroidota bacterium]
MKFILRMCCAGSIVLAGSGATAQVCTDNLNFVYGFTTGGIIYPVNVNTGVVGTSVATLPGGSTSANGVGYSNLNGKYYFFSITGTGAAPSPEFKSYDPGTATFATLASPSTANLPTNQKIRSGCMNNTGLYYYTINPKHTGVNTPALYCYSVAGNSWTTITTSFVDALSVSQNTNFNTLNSGDMAFDGKGNLWILLSNTSNYSLYKVAAPVPTTNVASVTVQQIIPVTPVPTAGFGFTGVAFNSAGTMFLTTGTGNDKLYQMTTIASGITLVGSLSLTDVGADLTSCIYPLGVLPVAAITSFTAICQQGNTSLNWTAMEDEVTSGYRVDYSADGSNWSAIGSIEKKLPDGGSNHYSFTHHLQSSLGFYRIVQTSAGGHDILSAVKWVSGSSLPHVIVRPNPASEAIYLFNLPPSGSLYRARIYDKLGRLVLNTTISSNQAMLPISNLKTGAYVLQVSGSSGGAQMTETFIKR